MGLGTLITASTAIFIFAVISGVHKVDEGYIGLYYVGGILSEKYTEPGFNWMIPVLSQFETVQVTIQTDEVKNIPCGTSGGILIYFEKIEVVNRLKKELAVQTVRNYTTSYDSLWIYDKIHHEINQFCSKHSLQDIYIDQFESLDEQLVKQLQTDLSLWAPAIEIVGIRVTKPRIPESIRKNFEEMENQRTNFLLESEKQNVLLQQVRGKGKQELMKAQSELEVAGISIERQVSEKASEQQMASIQDQITYSSEMGAIDSDILTQRKELETAQMRLTQAYLQTEAIQALSQNVKFFIGEKIPQYMGNGAAL